MKIRLPYLYGAALGILTLGGSLAASAAPARPGVRVYTQPDGSTVSLSLCGDESLHYFVDEDGHIVNLDADGFYRIVGNDGQFTDIPAGKKLNLTAEQQSTLAALSPQKAFQAISARPMPMRAANNAVQRVAGTVPQGKWDNSDGHDIRNVPTEGERHVLVILVNFMDIKWSFADDPGKEMSEMLNSPGYNKYHCTGSARDYFDVSSNGMYKPIFDVYGPVELPNRCEYYGGNTGSMAGGGNDKNPYQMVVDACKLLDDTVDFSIYDTNNDGVVDNVYILFAGYGENEGAPSYTVWPHSFNLAYVMSSLPVHDGVKIDRYACSNELTYNKFEGDDVTMAGPGTFLHEFSHVLGLPDLYATNYSGAFTPGTYTLMDHGSYNNNGRTPPTYSIYERYALEWQKPIDITTDEEIRMLPMTDNGLAYRITIDPSDPTEYYLFENRQQTSWDSYIANHGMLIWHIDFDRTTWDRNVVNDTPSHQCIDLIEADNQQVSGSYTGIPWPGSSGNGQFSASSYPAFTNWDGKVSALPIANIYESNSGVINIRTGQGGNTDPSYAVASPVVHLEECSANSMEISWDKVAGAKNYAVSVTAMATDIFGSYSRRFVEGYEMKVVRDATSLLITGLEPNSSYEVEVYAVGENNVSAPALNNYFTVSDNFADVQPALSVTPDMESALLEWAEIPGAEYYTVTVATRENKEATLGDKVGFDNKKYPAGMLFPGATWDSRDNYYGESAPSLRFVATNGQLTSPQYTDDIESFSFWARTNRQNGELSIMVYSVETNPLDPFSEGKLRFLKEITEIAGDKEGTVVNVDGLPEGVHQVMMLFSFHTAGLNLSVDDMEFRLASGHTDTPVDGYDAVRVDDTSLRVNGLTKVTPYVAYMQAHNASGASVMSKTLHFTTTATMGVDEVISGNTPAYSFAAGVLTPLGDEALSVFSADGSIVALNARGSVILPARGLYIVKCGDKASKLIW